MQILIFIYFLIYITLAWLRLDWAIMILIVALPSYLIRFSIFGIPSTLLELMILTVFFIWLIKNRKEQIQKIKLAFDRKKQAKKINYPFGYEAIAVLIVSFIAAGVSGFDNSAFGIWKAYFFEPILFFLVIINLAFRQKDKELKLNFLFAPLTISAFLVSTLAIFQKISGLYLPAAWSDSFRVTSFFEYPNAIGLYLGPIVLILAGRLFYQAIDFKKLSLSQILNTIFIFLTIILSILSIYFARSEGALAGIAAGFVVFGLFATKNLRRITLALIIIISAGIIFVTPARNFAVEKITLRDLSGEIRKQQWRETWEMLKSDKIILGSGLANYQQAVKPYHQEGIFFNKDKDPDFRRKIVLFDEKYKSQYWQPVEVYLYPHNILLNFWTELGLLGLIAFVWIIIKYQVLSIKYLVSGHRKEEVKNKYIVIGLMCAMVVIIVHGLVDVPYFKNDLAVLFWTMLAIMGAIKLRIKNYQC